MAAQTEELKSNSVQALAELRERKKVEQEPLEQRADYWLLEQPWAEAVEHFVKVAELATALDGALGSE